MANNKVGRPTKYIPEAIYPAIEDYLATVNDTELPSSEGLALHLGVNTDTLYEWNKKHPEFSEALKKIAAKQKRQLMNDGMYGGKEVNASMAIFLLKAIHGLKDGGDTTNIQINVKPILGKEEVTYVPEDSGNGENPQP